MPQIDESSIQTRLREAFTQPNSSAIVLNEHNTMCDTVPLESVTDDMVVSTRPKNGILVVDADTKGIHDTAKRALSKLSIQQIIVWKSGSIVPGKRLTEKPYESKHLIVITPAGFTTVALAEALNTLGVPRNAIRYAEGGRTRPPLTQHRLRHPISLVSPDAETAIAWLHAANQPLGNDDDKFQGLPYEPIRPLRDLDQETLELAKHGNRDGRYANRDAAAFAFARRLAERGQEFETFMTFLTDPACAIGQRHREHVQFHGEQHMRTKALAQWNKAVFQCGQGVPKTDPDFHTHVESVCTWMAYALTYVGLNPRTRDSDRQIIAALAAEMIRHHSCVIMPGTQGMSLLMEVAINTVTAALARFETAGIIKIIKPDASERLNKADKYAVDLNRFKDQPTQIEINPRWSPEILNPHLFLPTTHACWDGNAMGASALWVYIALTEGELTENELIQKTTLGRKAVKNAISVLQYAGHMIGVALIDGPYEPEGTYLTLPLSNPQVLAQRIIDEVPFGTGTKSAKENHRKVSVETKRKGFKEYKDWKESKDAYEVNVKQSRNLTVPR